MTHITHHQLKRLSSYELTRDGIDLPGIAMGQACFNFATLGDCVSMTHPGSPDSIYSGNGAGQTRANAILDIDPVAMVNGCRGLNPGATAVNHPGCGVELAALTANIGNARAGDLAAQNICATEMVKIVARKNGLIPLAVGGNDQYQLHMQYTNWYGWDHWAISVKSYHPNKPRIYIQTIPGVPLAHACDRIWDEHLSSVTINIQELNPRQVTLINNVSSYGRLCIECGTRHGHYPVVNKISGGSMANKFPVMRHCKQCTAHYCSVHSATRQRVNRNLICGNIGCVGRVVI